MNNTGFISSNFFAVIPIKEGLLSIVYQQTAELTILPQDVLCSLSPTKKWGKPS